MTYQNVNSAAHFVVDVVIGFSDSSVVKQPGEQIRDRVYKRQPNFAELWAVFMVVEQIREATKKKKNNKHTVVKKHNQRLGRNYVKIQPLGP